MFWRKTFPGGIGEDATFKVLIETSQDRLFPFADVQELEKIWDGGHQAVRKQEDPRATTGAEEAGILELVV